MMTNGRGMRCRPNSRQWSFARRRGTGRPQRWQTLCVWAIVDRWRAGQSAAVRAGLVAPAIRTRLALADRAFAVALETQRGHPLADRGEIVGGAGCIWRHNSQMITLPESDCRRSSSADDVEPSVRQFFRSRQPRDPARDEVEIILDRKIPPCFVELLANQLLLVHAPVMPEHGCSIVKTEMAPIAGRAQLGGCSRVAYSALSTSTGSRGLCRTLASIWPARGARRRAML